MDLDTLLKKLSTKEKIALCEGADFWHTRHGLACPKRL